MNLKLWLKDNREWRRHADLLVKPPTAEELIAKWPECPLRDAELMASRRVKGQPYTSAAFYWLLRTNKNSHRLACALACQTFAGIETEDTFWSGYTHFSEVYGEAYAADVKRRLAEQGCNLDAHKEYLPELAQYRGDPRAVIDRSRGRAYIRKRCREMGFEWYGDDNVEALPPEKDPFDDAIPLAEDLVQESISDFRQEDPDTAAKMSDGELREMVVEKHGFH